jgi:hypothetical protein
MRSTRGGAETRGASTEAVAASIFEAERGGGDYREVMTVK